MQQRRGADVQRSTKPIESHAPAAGVAFVAPAQAKASKALRTDATAVECYAAAIEAERQARLSEATTLYRRAFRLDPDVERSFHALALVQDKNESEAKPEDDALAFEFARTVQVAADYEEKAGKRVLTSDLRERLLRSIEANPYCRVEKIKDGAEEVEPMPADDQLAYHAVEAEGDAKVPLNRLPVEVIANILAHLALPANAQYFPRIEMLEARFGRLCRRARLDSLEQPLWRRVCQRVYRHPQVASPSTFDSLASRYAFDYRRMWIEHARVRTDGCYIGVQRYTRRGTAEGAWVNPSFAVTYFRFLRRASFSHFLGRS